MNNKKNTIHPFFESKLFMLLVVLLPLLGCNKTPAFKDINEKVDVIEDIDLGLNEDGPNNITLIRKWFERSLIEPKAGGINIMKINAEENISIFFVALSNDYPTSLNKKYSVVYLKNQDLTYLIPFEFNVILKNKELQIGGFRESRECDYYMIYEFRSKKLHLVLNSQDDCRQGLKVGFYRNDECIEYNPNRLIFEQKNENEISFNGTLLYYCKLNFDRNETDTIINKKVIKVTYNFNPDLSKWILKKETYPCW